MTRSVPLALGLLCAGALPINLIEEFESTDQFWATTASRPEYPQFVSIGYS